jgi:glycosyltransferase involved in cell wall biosynthesis
VSAVEARVASARPVRALGGKDSPIRVLHIITRLIVGGAQENTLLSVEGLDRLPPFDVTLASGLDQGPEGELLSRARTTTHLIEVPALTRSVSPLSDARAFAALYRLIRRGRYHIVHTHSSKAGVLGRLAAKAAGTPVIVHTLHSMVFHRYQPWLVNRTLRLVKRACAPATDHYISVADAMTELAVEAGIAERSRFSTIYSGMELDWFLEAPPDGSAVRDELGIPPDAPVVGKIARLFPLKGHKELMDAAPAVVARQPDVRFLLIGDGILQDELRERAREAGIVDNFVFAGLIPRERIPAMLSAMDVLVHTSLREGLARVLPQALAMGVPCVAFDLDGAPEVVIDGETGLLTRPGDDAGLAEAIVRLLQDPELRCRMGAAGRRLVDPRWRIDTMIDNIAELYLELIERKANAIARFEADRQLQVTQAAPGKRR